VPALHAKKQRLSCSRTKWHEIGPRKRQLFRGPISSSLNEPIRISKAPCRCGLRSKVQLGSELDNPGRISPLNAVVDLAEGGRGDIGVDGGGIGVEVLEGVEEIRA
jgi:hypothetical protein